MLFLTIGLIIISFDQTFAQCNICGNASKSICLSSNTFKICDDENKPIDELGKFWCPRGFVCVDDPYRCLPVETATPLCGSKCEICDPVTNVACINYDTFEFCFDGKNSEESTARRVFGICKNGKVCNSESPLICVDIGIQEPTCPDYSITTTPSTTAPTTTVSITEPSIPTLTPTPSNPDDICKKIGKKGKYPIPGNCNSYIICMMSGNFMIGRQYNCLDGHVYDCKIRKCIIINTATGHCDYSCSF